MAISCPFLPKLRQAVVGKLALAPLRPDDGRMQDHLFHMRTIVERHANGPRRTTALPRVTLHAGGMVTRPTPGVYEPCVCLVLQGAKQIMVGDRSARAGLGGRGHT